MTARRVAPSGKARIPWSVLARGLLPALLATACSEASDPSLPPAFVGAEACADCHPAQSAAWRGSDHDLAMQPASGEAVLGDFAGASFTYAGVTTTFSRQNGEFRVRTDGPDGRPADYRIAYTFGVEPLQQYLVPLPGGRLQALGIAWDARPAAKGGQRWFHLYPGGEVDHRDELHWTGDAQTWNHACAECHSTGVVKAYDLESDRYATTWAEVDVACEACHGPGSHHVAWARDAAVEDGARKGGGLGLAVFFHDRRGAAWTLEPATGISRRSAPPGDRREVEACARCHSLRSALGGGYVWGEHLLGTHRPDLILPGLYFPDGQIRDEVYEYGSFRQSRMYRAGVTCSDCHDPHGLEPRAEGNALCGVCHEAARFDTPEHHHHPAGSLGTLCVECHMPPRTYMQVDVRRDHRLGIPDPGRSARLGAPDACTTCHSGRSAEWAAAAVEAWYGRDGRPPGFAEAFAADDRGEARAGAALAAVAGDSAQPGIVRASALARLSRWPEALSPAWLEDAAADPEPLVRFGALLALEGLEPAQRAALAGPALGDPLAGVRQEAVRILSGAPDSLLGAAERRAFDRAAAEYVAGLLANADRPWALLELAAFRASRGELEPALGVLRRGLEIHPDDPDLLAGTVTAARASGRTGLALEQAERLLELFPEDPGIRRLVEELREEGGSRAR